MKHVVKSGSFENALVLADDAAARIGTLAVIGGGLLAMASFMF